MLPTSLTIFSSLKVELKIGFGISGCASVVMMYTFPPSAEALGLAELPGHYEGVETQQASPWGAKVAAPR